MNILSERGYQKSEDSEREGLPKVKSEDSEREGSTKVKILSERG